MTRAGHDDNLGRPGFRDGQAAHILTPEVSRRSYKVLLHSSGDSLGNDLLAVSAESNGCFERVCDKQRLD